jgi:hypothetical protein
MANLTSVVKHLQQERIRLSAQLDRVNHALSVLSGMSSGRTDRTISPAGRARIAAAQRARWAKVKGQKAVGAHKGRTMSPAARKRIIAAQKARWAKWRKEQNKA